MSTKKTSLTSETTASFEKLDAELEIDLEIGIVTVPGQACDEVFFDVFVTKQQPVILGCTEGSVSEVESVTFDFLDYVSFQDTNSQSFNKVGAIITEHPPTPKITVMGNVKEIISKKNPTTGKITKTAINSSRVSFIFDDVSQKIITNPSVSVFALLSVGGKRKGKRHRWTGPINKKSIVYAFHEASGKSATLEVNLEGCGGSIAKKNVNNLSLGVELTDFYVSDCLVIGGEHGATYSTYGSFVVWPVPTFAEFYAVYFINAELQAFDWDDLALALETKGDREQVELMTFTASETGSLQYAPLGNAVTFSILGNFTGRYDDNKSASSVQLKGPGETVYRRTNLVTESTDPKTGKTVQTIVPSDESITVGPTEVYCVDWVNNVIVKGTGKAVVVYSCPARLYSFKLDAPTLRAFWTKWNCQANVGYTATEVRIGEIVGNGSFSIPNPFEKLKAMWDEQAQSRYDELIALGFRKDFALKGNY